jgi:hypothetical protein
MLTRRWFVSLTLAGCVLLLAAGTCFGIASTDHLAGPEQKIPADTSWPRGVAAFVNDPARTDAWHGWFSELPNDVCDYQLRATNVAELNRLIARFAEIESDHLQIILAPDAPPDRIGYGQRLTDQQRQAVVFRLGNQPILNQWYAHLKPDADGRRTFGVHRLDKPPVALPPTLVIYTRHPAVDLVQLVIPAGIEVQAQRLAPNSDAATKARHAEIEQLLNSRQ